VGVLQLSGERGAEGRWMEAPPFALPSERGWERASRPSEQPVKAGAKLEALCPSVQPGCSTLSGPAFEQRPPQLSARQWGHHNFTKCKVTGDRRAAG